MDTDIDAGRIVPAVKFRLRAVDAEGRDEHIRRKNQIGRREPQSRTTARTRLHNAGDKLAVAKQARGSLAITGAQKRADGC